MHKSSSIHSFFLSLFLSLPRDTFSLLFHLLFGEEHVLPYARVVLHELELHRVLLGVPPLKVDGWTVSVSVSVGGRKEGEGRRSRVWGRETCVRVCTEHSGAALLARFFTYDPVTTTTTTATAG